MQDIVQCEYDKLTKVANEFEEAGQRVHQLLQAISNQQNVLQGGGWIAPSASRFYSSMNDDVNPGIGRLFQALKEASSTLHQISSNFQSADEQASSHLRIG
jgi:WXG100 family type VII secretion target